MSRPKKFKFERGQTICIVKDSFNYAGNKPKRMCLGEWDIIRVYKKSILVQNWPTYEQRLIKFW